MTKQTKTTKRILTDKEHAEACEKQLERLGYKDKTQTISNEDSAYVLTTDFIIRALRVWEKDLAGRDEPYGGNLRSWIKLAADRLEELNVAP